MITIRRSGPEDIDAIAVLQAENLFANLTAAQRADGFLSAAFSADQLLRMSEDLGIDAAFDGDDLVAYLCAFRCADVPRPPVIEAMLAAFPQSSFAGAPLDPERCYLYGPACIARSHRGGALLSRLLDAQRQRLASAFAQGAAFIAQTNTRSLRAHTVKLGMQRAGNFQCNGATYHIVAFHTRPAGDPHGQQ